MPSFPPDAWYPIAGAVDAPPRHVCQAELLGQELAVWRADDGFVNVWVNRCLHRGVRLSIGINDGHELRCQYHNWRYANRTGGCTYIPAHPGDAPSAGLCVTRFPAVERYGLVWTTFAGAGVPPDVPALAGEGSLALRGVPFDAPASVVSAAELGDGAVWFVQPVDDEHCVVRGVVPGPVADADRPAVLKAFDDRLGAQRERLEKEHHASVAWGTMPSAVTPAPPAAIRTGDVAVVVRRKWATAEGVAAFELAAVEGLLPTVQPGAHVDVHLPNGLVRQYSLVNGPGEQDVYRIGVKREPLSEGGSACLHDDVAEGDRLAISAPHSNFALRRDAMRTVLVAGGIGITPLLAMAQALHTTGSRYELHVFAQSGAHVAFAEVVDGLGSAVHRHLGLDGATTVAEIERVLGPFRPNSAVYVCGPAPMLEATRDVAARLGWPDEAVHFEYFKNTRVIDDDSSFEVELARAGRRFVVPAGRTVLDVLREHGIAVESSCEQGACGTCLVGVLEGRPDHQDVYLRASEHARNDRMTVCVSRSLDARLVLDL